MKEYFLNRAKFFDEKLAEYMEISNNPQKTIYEAMSYSLLTGGKRMRPMLMSEVCKMCGGDANVVIPFAVALEMIHTYSLIHDDLPAMDNDDLRRGMPTNHIKFGEANAILAGDALLNRAFEVMSEAKGLPAETVVKVIALIAKSSGTEGMIGGQVVDIQSEGQDLNLDELRYIHSLKTGAIIKSSCVAGAMLAGATDDEINAVADFAENLGIAFQIQDDILDVLGTEENLGKPIGSDADNGKNTYVTICGMDKAHELMLLHTSAAENSLKRFGDKAAFLKWLLTYLTAREN